MTFNQFFIYLASIVFLSAFLGFYGLTRLKNTKRSALRKLFYVPARKSVSDAVQLGGLPLAVSYIIGVVGVIVVEESNPRFSGELISTLKFWLPSAAVLTTYGYLDDKYEIRPVFKLFAQCICVILFSIFASQITFPSYSTLSFLVLMFWGLGVLNGSNLLDGLDTLTIKVALTTLAGYAGLSLVHGTQLTLYLSILMALPICAFYFFNKEPSKIHLGEIGGSFVGLVFLKLSAILFVELSTAEKFSTLEAMGLVLMPLNISMIELGISFLRRLYNKKSPFRGDKMHIHHILRNYYKYSASNSSTIIMSGLALTYWPAIVSAHFIHPLVSLSALITVQTGLYFLIGKKYWVGDGPISISAKSIFDYLRKKDVMVIDTSSIDDFQLIIVEKNESGESVDDDPTDETREAS